MAQPLIDDLLPGGAPPDPDEALEASDDALDQDDLTLTVDPPPTPLGRSLAFDFTTGTIPRQGLGHREVTGEAALRLWVEKCLRTMRGVHPACPNGYGLAFPLNDLLGDTTHIEDAEDAFREALTFHPAITDVRNFDYAIGETAEGDGAVEIAFTIVLDDGNAVGFQTTLDNGQVTTSG